MARFPTNVGVLNSMLLVSSVRFVVPLLFPWFLLALTGRPAAEAGLPVTNLAVSGSVPIPADEAI
eukprot:4525081-Heterocapsa_arctica.AAC.1